MKMIEELFYGNVDPSCRPLRRGSPLEKLAKLVTRNNDLLLTMLTEEVQRKQFEKCWESQSELAARMEAEAFTEGFCLAAKLMSEVMERTETPDIDD